MKYVLYSLILLLISSCSSSERMKEGHWTGTLTPMNHPDMANPVAYDVAYDGGELIISLTGPDGTPVSTRNPRLEGDSLFFSFDEPEQQVPLDCAFGKTSSGAFEGRCTDASGQWARFTMVPPDNSDQQPMSVIGSWYGEDSNGNRQLFVFRNDTTALWIFYPPAAADTFRLSYEVDYSVTPHSFELRGFDRGFLKDQALYGILEFVHPDTFRLDVEPGPEDTAADVVRPKMFTEQTVYYSKQH